MAVPDCPGLYIRHFKVGHDSMGHSYILYMRWMLVHVVAKYVFCVFGHLSLMQLFGVKELEQAQEILSSLLMFCFFALCFVCPLPVLLMWTPRPAANVHKGTYKSLTHTHNVCQICTEYDN